MGVDETGVDKVGVDKMGVDEMGSRKSGMTPLTPGWVQEFKWCRPTSSTSHFVYSHFVYSYFVYSYFFS